MSPLVALPVEGGPKWISHLELSRHPDGRVAIRIVKHNDEDYGSAIVEQYDLVKALEIL